jgi:protein-S-isoprenylcysteine O-methyltransferase Ste14
VAQKTILGFLQLLLFLAVALMAPAWTLRYWQAWVYLAVFIGSSALITVYLWKQDPKLLERRVRAGPGAEKEARQNWIQTFASIAFLGQMVLPSLDHRLGWSRVPLFLVIMGDALVLLGFVVVFLVFRENSFTSATIEVAPDQQVISTGPYAIVRHPMYSGALIMLLGTPIALGSWWGLAAFPPMLAAIVARLLDEERLLAIDLAGYRDYCATVRYRLVPLAW